MPNTRPRAILGAEDVVWYREEIERVLTGMSGVPPFEPLMTIEIRDNTTPAIVREAKKAGAVAGKVYPLGATTNSDHGLRSFSGATVRDTFGAMQEIGMPLLLHGEALEDRLLVTKREERFLETLEHLARDYPRLKIVLEHVSTKAGVEAVKQLEENVAATITAHHLCLTLNDVIGEGIRPHNGCMPMPKDFDDRDTLIAAATSGDPKFFLGSDTAPHHFDNKECAKGACGVFSAPVLPQVLAEVFEEAGALGRLEDFTSRFGAQFYELPLNEGTITLERKPWTVPDVIGEIIVPFKAEEELQWRLVA